MDRRWAGLVLLIVVVLGAVALPHLAGRRVVGSAAAIVLPAPPAVGACVTAMSSSPSPDPETPDDAPISYPYAVYGSCTGAVIGEVMSTDLTRHPPVDSTVGASNRAGAACRLDEVNYVGSVGPFDPATITRPGIGWQAAAFVDSVVVGPGPLERAGGQGWTACIGTSASLAPYRGRLADALRSGVLPPEFAVCWNSLAVSTVQQGDGQQTSCASPHPIEVLATAQILDPDTTTPQVERSCLELASRAMRTTRPTRGGALRISAYSMDGGAVVPLTISPLLAGYVGCIASVTPPHSLVGTLIGLGDRPAPITG